MPLSYDDEAYDPASVVDIKPKMEDPSKGLIQFRIGDQIRHIIELSDLSPKQKKRCSIGLEIIVAKLFSVWSLRDRAKITSHSGWSDLGFDRVVPFREHFV